MSEKRLTKYKNNLFHRIVNSVLDKVLNEENALSIWGRLPSFMQNADVFDMVAEKVDKIDVLSLTKNQITKNQKFNQILDNGTYGDVMLAWEVVGRDIQNEFLQKIINKYTREEKIDVTSLSIDQIYDGINSKYLMRQVYENLSPDLIEKAIDMNVQRAYQEPKEQERVKILINEFMTRNKNLMSTLDIRILNKHILNAFRKEEIEYIANYPTIQESILELKDDEALRNFRYILDYDLVDFRERIGNYHFKFFCNENSNKDLLNLSSEEKDKVISIVTSDSAFNLSKLSELDQYYQNKKEICLKIIQSPEIVEEEYEKEFSDNDEISSTIPWLLLCNMKDLSETERVKYAIIETKYCMSYEKAKNLCNYFGDDIDQIEQTEETRIIKELKEILAENDIEKLRQINLDENINNYKGILNLYPNLKNLYLKEYQKVLYQVNENDFIGKQTVHLENKNKDTEVKIYNAMGKNNDKCDFNMILTSLGGIYFHHHDYSDMKKDWDRADENHTISCSFIRNDFLGVVDDNYLLAFADITENELLQSRNKDAGSGDVVTAYFEEGLLNRFLIPENQVNLSKERYNEMVVERKVFQEGKFVNRKPTYAVYFAETIEDIDNNQNDRWESTKRMAAELDIPIVVIDCKRCAELEFNKVQEMLKEFQETKQIDLIRKIVFKFENNRGGSSLGGATKEIKNTFSKERMVECLESIIHTLENSDMNTFNKGMDELICVSKELEELYHSLWNSNEEVIVEENFENEYNHDSKKAHIGQKNLYSEYQTYNYNHYIQRCEILKRTRNSFSESKEKMSEKIKDNQKESEEK